MVYKAIGSMSNDAAEGLDLAFIHFHETGGKWTYELVQAGHLPYDAQWKDKLLKAAGLNAVDYQVLHTSYGHYIGKQINRFIDEHNLHHQVHLIASHGYTSFHLPGQKMTAQLGHGAAIAAVTGLPVVSDLRAMDIALDGQGYPISAIADKLLLPVADENMENYKDALTIALMGVLRWREEYNMLAEFTGASRNSVNGALWLGGEA